jgi:hypothetical protein
VALAGGDRGIDRGAIPLRLVLQQPCREIATISLEPLPPSTPDSFAAYIKSEVERWALIVKNSGAELE